MWQQVEHLVPVVDGRKFISLFVDLGNVNVNVGRGGARRLHQPVGSGQ